MYFLHLPIKSLSWFCPSVVAWIASQSLLQVPSLPHSLLQSEYPDRSHYRAVSTIRLKIPPRNYLILHSLSLENHSYHIVGAQYILNDSLKAQIHDAFLIRLETVDEGSLVKIREPFLR